MKKLLLILAKITVGLVVYPSFLALSVVVLILSLPLYVAARVANGLLAFYEWLFGRTDGAS